MSFSAVPIKRKCLEVNSINSLPCIFCNNVDNVVQQPKAESYVTIQNASLRRKDEITKKFESLYNSNLNKQKFSWHKSCFATYVSEQKIRRREIELQKEVTNDENATCSELSPSTSQRSSRQKMDPTVTSKCVICNMGKKNQTSTTFTLSSPVCAEKLLTGSRSKLDDVFTTICECDSVEKILARNFRYHKDCLKNYLCIKKNHQKKGKIFNTNFS